MIVCVSGVYFVGDVVCMVKFGDVDVMVVGGIEFSIDLLLMVGFCRCIWVYYFYFYLFRVFLM